MLNGAAEVVVVSLSTRGSAAAFTLVSASVRVLAFTLVSASVRASGSARASAFTLVSASVRVLVFTLASASVPVSPFAARAALTTGGDRPSSAGWHSALPLPHRRRSGGRHRPCSTRHRRAGMHLPLDGDPVAVRGSTASATYHGPAWRAARSDMPGGARTWGARRKSQLVERAEPAREIATKLQICSVDCLRH